MNPWKALNTLNSSPTCSKSVLKDRDFEPDDPETLLAAFKMLDPEGKGYIEIEEMRRHLETEGYRRMLFQNRIQSEGNSGFY
jgi:Ca2+-binding EF-hand superfamily protein